MKTCSLGRLALLPLLVGFLAAGEAPGDRAEAVEPAGDPELERYGIYQETAPRAAETTPLPTTLPLTLRKGDRIALIGNTLLERSQYFGHLEAMLHQRFPEHELIVRNLAWSADTPGLQPRPANFADTEQHLRHERADVIFAAFGFNESFAGEAGLEAFRKSLHEYVGRLKSRAFNGRSGPRIVLISPIANENVPGVPAGELNNERIAAYAEAVRSVAAEQQVGFADAFSPTLKAMADASSGPSPGGQGLTFNGVHLTDEGYRLFSAAVYRELFDEDPTAVNEDLREAVLDKNRHYFRRFRPLNTFYYTGDRNRDYGYLDFLPAMRSFDVMVANRERRTWDIARGKPVPERVDDSNVPEMPSADASRGANEWVTPEEELRAFQVDPRFEVSLFASEVDFPEIAAPIQIRWDAKGRLWVSCSTTYPHVYPGNEPNDKLVILEDTTGDGKADTSTVFADDLHIPLSFEFGDGGVFVSEMPHLTFLKDTSGDGKADFRRELLTGFGTEDSHHALHDFVWTPDGDLIFRESIFHHSQVETPYGPVRQRNSGWFRFEPRTHRLTSFGTYHSTNPWGVAFDDWGQHVASHPVYAAAFHSLDPPYPQQHPRPVGLNAYSGTCGHEFVDFPTFPEELQGDFIKVRYKPTNRVEIHKWNEGEFGYEEQYVGDLIFSTNLSFIPVDIQFGPRGDLYVCDWYNPVKGHMQYSLRDERRDRHSGRIWRITAKGKPLQDPPRIDGAPIRDLLEILKRPEYRYRYWARRELRERDPGQVKRELDRWVAALSPDDPRYRHHQMEAVWTCRTINAVNVDLLRELLECDDRRARAAATQQLRHWHSGLPDAIDLLRRAANDPNGIVRMEAAIAASYVGSKEALQALLEVFNHPREGHLAYAITCALGSHTLRRHWEEDPASEVPRLLKELERTQAPVQPRRTAAERRFDTQENLKVMRIDCVPERMRFTLEQFAVTTGQPVKLLFSNQDATDHNLLIVQPDALEEVGMAANEMARDPRNANSDFIPQEKRHLIIEATPMIGPTRRSQLHVLRFHAPSEPGIYPYVCTFPGHWVIMKGEMVVADDLSEVEAMLAARKPEVVRQWTLDDFEEVSTQDDERTVMRGMQAFRKARCSQCHIMAGHGTSLGPELTKVGERFQGKKLLQRILEPSVEIHKDYQPWQFLTTEGRILTGVIREETPEEYHVVTNLLAPDAVTRLKKREIDQMAASKISPMPQGLLDVLTREEILDLTSFLESGGYRLPEHLERAPRHQQPAGGLSNPSPP